MKLTKEEVGLLDLADRYGDGLDLRGPHISPRVRKVARGLIASGHLRGKIGGLVITDAGRAVLQEQKP